MSEANKAILKALYDVFNGAPTTDVDKYIAAGSIDHEKLPGVDTSGPEGFVRVVQIFRAAFPDLQATVEELIAEGDLVVAYYRMKGTNRGEFMGMPATNKPFEINGFDMIRVADGKAVEHWGHSDQVGMMMQLGLMPAPGH